MPVWAGVVQGGVSCSLVGTSPGAGGGQGAQSSGKVLVAHWNPWARTQALVSSVTLELDSTVRDPGPKMSHKTE